MGNFYVEDFAHQPHHDVNRLVLVVAAAVGHRLAL